MTKINLMMMEYEANGLHGQAKAQMIDGLLAEHKGEIKWLLVLSSVAELLLLPDYENAILLLIFNFLLWPAAFIDFRYMYLFNRLLYPLFYVGLFAGVVLSIGNIDYILSVVAGSLTLGGSLLLLQFISRGGLGAGDVKYGFAIGIWLCWQQAVAALMVAFMAGGGVALCYMIYLVYRRKPCMGVKIPFGPFLALGAVVSFMYGTELFQKYISLLQYLW